MSRFPFHMRATRPASTIVRQEFGLTSVQILVVMALLIAGLVAVAKGFHLARGAMQTVTQQTRPVSPGQPRLEQATGIRPELRPLDVGHEARIVGDGGRTTVAGEAHTQRSEVRRPHPVLAGLALARLLLAGELRRREASSGRQPASREQLAELVLGHRPARHAAHGVAHRRSPRRWWERMIALVPERIFDE
ncbi:MAG: hypothetical protein ACE5FK_00730 [Candidatus Methylomirabilia bacterium]